MKKIVLLTSLFLTLSSYCQEQDQVSPIIDSIIDEYLLSDPQSAEWTLKTFLQSQKAAALKQKIEPLLPDQKNRILSEINHIGVLNVWPIRRDFLALAIEAGGNINGRYGKTFLTQAVENSDLPAVKFAFAHNADPILETLGTYPLQFASNYAVAKLLIDHDGLEPFKADKDQKFNLLRNALNKNISYRLLQLYEKNGLSFKELKNSDNDTLLHWLVQRDRVDTTPFNFFEKFRILFKAGAVDLNARNNKNETVLDILKRQDQNNATVKLATQLLEGLRDNSSLWQSRLGTLDVENREHPSKKRKIEE